MDERCEPVLLGGSKQPDFPTPFDDAKDKGVTW